MNIDKNYLLKEIHILLDKAEIPVNAQSDIINQMLNNSHYDMNLKMDIMEHSVKFYMYERGKIVFEKRVEDERTIIYIILENVLSIYSNILAHEESKKQNGYIDMRSIKRAEGLAFEKMGDPYKTMYKNEVTIYNI